MRFPSVERGHSLSLRARAIQRKSIHSLSTGAAPLALALAACAGSGAGMTAAGDRVLVPDPAMISIRPDGTGLARFLLTSGGVPINGQRVTFSIVDAVGTSEDDPKGATLGDTSAVTDVSGVAAVDVHAGAATTFKIRATAGSTQATPLVVVVALGTGSVVVAPYFVASSSPSSGPPSSIDVWIFDGLPCADIMPANPPTAAAPLGMHKVPGSGGTTRFDFVTTSEGHAVVGRARDPHGAVIAVGCVDVAAASLVMNGQVQVWLPLRAAVPDPIGTFTLTSYLDFEPPLAAAAAIAGPWRDLGDCPLDPAQLFLDCTIDALSPETAGDPLDCKPNPTPGGEGTLGDLFAARRGVPIVDGTGVRTSCRGAVDASGAPSLDAIALGLFGSPTPALLVALPAIGEQAAHVLDSVRLTSTLAVSSSELPDQYVVTHRLVSAGFGSSEAVALAPLALPALTAYTTAATRDRLLIIDQHGFTLRLGRVARAGFGATALTPRLPAGLTGDGGGLVAGLAMLARSGDADLSGCAAFDRALCAAVGKAAGCLATACPAGLSALAARLDAAFDAADGPGLDFSLSGSAPLLDMHNDGTASRLGRSDPSATEIAIWSIDLTTASGRTRVTASFEGVRN